MTTAAEEQVKFNQMLKELALLAWPTPEAYAKDFPNKPDSHVSWIWEKPLSEQVKDAINKTFSETRLTYKL